MTCMTQSKQKHFHLNNFIVCYKINIKKAVKNDKIEMIG